MTRSPVTPYRWALFGFWLLICCVAFVHPLVQFAELIASNSDVSYLALIPFISVWLLITERRRIFHKAGTDVWAGLVILAACALPVSILLVFDGAHLEQYRLSLELLCLILLWIAGFVVAFGRESAKAASFSLWFLLLMVPLPQPLLDRIVYLLQAGSAEVTGWLFDVFKVPSLREGFVFHLPQVNIEIAKECSGIRSSTALLVLALIAIHLYLKTPWKKAVFLGFGIAMMIVKNGIRIVTLTLLAVHVDPGFLTGRLHHEGGFVFFLIGLLPLAPVFWLLYKTEKNPAGLGQSQNQA